MRNTTEEVRKYLESHIQELINTFVEKSNDYEQIEWLSMWLEGESNRLSGIVSRIKSETRKSIFGEMGISDVDPLKAMDMILDKMKDL